MRRQPVNTATLSLSLSSSEEEEERERERVAVLTGCLRMGAPVVVLGAVGGGGGQTCGLAVWLSRLTAPEAHKHLGPKEPHPHIQERMQTCERPRRPHKPTASNLFTCKASPAVQEAVAPVSEPALSEALRDLRSGRERFSKVSLLL